MLIRAFHKLKDNCPDWDLVILGDGEEKESLNKLLSDLQINDRVTLPGSVGNMAEWYERSNIFVLSSILEGFPNVLLEAMTYGLPCVSFDCDTGPRDMIIDGVNGILVKPDHGDYGLTNAMNKLISDEELRDKFARNSMLLREKYSVTNIMREWDNVLKL